jgi:protein phosphatase
MKTNSQYNIKSQNITASLQLCFGGYSHKGLKEENQDAFAVYCPSNSDLTTKGAIAALADGVSSASNAAQAAQLAVTQFTQEYYSTSDTWSTEKSASKVLTSLNQWLYSQADSFSTQSSHHQPQQWLTTFSSLIFKSTTGYIFHVGDSRISKFRSGEFESITRDHNRKQGGEHVVLTRALGADSRLKVDFHKVDIQKSDVFLLTCDGVHDFVSKKEFKEQLGNLPSTPSENDLEKASKSLAELAIKNGSHDNVSCLLVYISNTPKRQLIEIERDILSKVIPPALSIGMKLDNYKVCRVIHASIRSHLYLVEDEKSQIKSVLKVPSQNFADDTVYLQGFMREAWVGERVDQNNIMKVKTENNDSRFLYHVCEYIEGQTLSAWMHDNPKPSIAKVRDIISQVISALRAFQRLELVHRDLKPENIMIDTYGQIKLIDYGTVLVASLDEDINTIEETVPQGTLNYIAPETLLSMKSDNMSDLFSLGVICYEMLTGELPFKPMQRAEVTQQNYDDWQYRSIKQFRHDIPFWLDLSLQQCTQPNPQLRYQAFSEFQADLTKPNLTAIEEYKKQPILQRDPIKFWQGMSFILFTLLIISVAN